MSKNTYEGKTLKEVWDGMTKEQRKHFLKDHYTSEAHNDEWREKVSKEEYGEIGALKMALEEHVKEGSYAKGGEVKIGKTHFNSHENHNPSYDILEGYIDGDTFITYVVGVKDENKGNESMEVYSGQNYVVGSNKKSHSRVYKVDAIPEKYKSAWLDLKKRYEAKEYKDGGDVDVCEYELGGRMAKYKRGGDVGKSKIHKTEVFKDNMPFFLPTEVTRDGKKYRLKYLTEFYEEC